MKDFMEKWRTDSKFKAMIKLCLYSLFAILATIIALSNRPNMQLDELEETDDQNEIDIVNIEIPDKYNYIIDITIDENNYQYIGNKELEKETITKIISEITTNYKYEEDKYYKEENNQYISTTKDEIYDVVNYNYLQLETINKYLLKSEKSDDKYLVYLKDIVLGNGSEEYISIEIIKNVITNQQVINIDYTSLAKVFSKNTEKYYIQIKIEEIE